MKKSLLLGILLLLLAGSMLAASDDARFLNISTSYEVQSDGTVLLDYSHQVRLDTPFGINRLGETFLTYDPRFQELKVLAAETTMRDGKVVKSPANAFNEVLPFGAHNFPAFTPLREMVVTHTGLERGAVVALHYQLRTRPGFFSAFSARETLGRPFPVDSFRLQVSVPDTRRLRTRVLGADLRPTVSHANGRTVWTVTAANIPAQLPEVGAREADRPAAVCSCAASWEEALPRLQAGPVPKALAERLDTLRHDHPGTLDLLMSVQKLVAEEVDTCPLPPTVTGAAVRSLEDVWSGDYGTRFEKAALLAASLSHLQLPAEVVAVAGSLSFAEDVPAAAQMESFLVQVNAPGGPYFLDPAGQQTELYPYRYEGRPAYRFGARVIEKLPESNAERNHLVMDGKVTLGTEGCSGAASVKVSGYLYNYPAAVENTRGALTAALAKVLPGADWTVKRVVVLSPTELQADVEFKGAWLTALGDGAWSLPHFKLPMVAEEQINSIQRSTPLALDVPIDVSVHLEAEAGPGLAIDYTATPVHVSNAVGLFDRKVEAPDPKKIVLDMAFTLSHRVVAPQAYADFRALVLPSVTPGVQLILRKANP